MTNPTQTAERLKPFARLDAKPILASWMGGAAVAAGESILASANIPTFPYPDSAAVAFHYMWQYSYNLRSLYETPILASEMEEGTPRRALADAMVEEVRRSGRTLLTEIESKQLLASYGIPTVETLPADTEQEAASVASRLGYPVVLKVLSQTLTHKAAVGGVHLNLGNAEAVRRAFQLIKSSVGQKAGAGEFSGVAVQPMIPRDGLELILGSSVDPQFGPVVLFGAGGELVEVLGDRCLGLPPLNTTLARRLMERTRIYAALQGLRGHPPVDLTALEQLLVRFSQLVVEQPWIQEMDINPLFVSRERLLALDARVVLHGSDVPESKLPKRAIRPYPAQYVTSWMTSTGERAILRPIRPEDEPLMVRFHETLSEQSVYFRYFGLLTLDQRTAHDRLTRICFNDYDREIALVAVRRDGLHGGSEVIAASRLLRRHGSPEAEIAILVADRFQRMGLGTELVRQLLQIARQEGIRRLTAEILPENHAMQRIGRKLGFRFRYDPQHQVVRTEIVL